MIKLRTLIKEEDGDKTKAVMTDFIEFASNRLKGAEKIAKDAKKKGGDALLTYHHFDVKLPYYEDAKSGKFDVLLTKDKLKDKIEQVGLLSGPIHIEQIHFQRLLGEMEVLGELIIKWNELNLR
jgi:hypothetical protein